MPMFYECDGCRARLEYGFETRNLALKNELVNANATAPAQLWIECFCVDCARQAESYWAAKAGVIEKAAGVFASTVDNHRRSFFGKTKIREVSK